MAIKIVFKEVSERDLFFYGVLLLNNSFQFINLIGYGIVTAASSKINLII